MGLILGRSYFCALRRGMVHRAGVIFLGTPGKCVLHVIFNPLRAGAMLVGGVGCKMLPLSVGVNKLC